MLTYSPAQLFGIFNYSLPSSISVIKQLGLLRRRRYIHRSSRRRFVLSQHGLCVPFTRSTARSVTQLSRHQDSAASGPFNAAIRQQLIRQVSSPLSSRTAILTNLRPLQPAPIPPPSGCVNFALLNTRSLTNKAPIIHELILDNNLDLLLLTEIWQQPN
ncbi:unnamed protein product [Arctogadus glacialis]